MRISEFANRYGDRFPKRTQSIRIRGIRRWWKANKKAELPGWSDKVTEETREPGR